MAIKKLKRRILGVFMLAVCCGATPFTSFAATYFVLAGGTGNNNGTGWANAACKIPSNLAPGDVVYIGNSGGNLANTATPCAGEARHLFSTSGTSGSHITIKAATGADHGTPTGWNASYGVDVTPGITWSNSYVPSDGLKNPFWDMCGSYYDINGQVGTADQAGSYGFKFRSAGRMFGFIRIESHQCGEATIANLTFKFLELDGAEANSTLNGVQPGGTAFDFGSSVITTASVGPLVIDHSYVHDVFSPVASAGNTQGLTLTNSYIERNFSDHAQHSNGIDTQTESGGTIGISNLDVHDDVFADIQGTGIIVCLNGLCDGARIYNNVVYYSATWDATCTHGDSNANCGVSKTFGDNTPSGIVTNSVFYGNTISGIHIKPGQPGALDAGVVIQNSASIGNIARNNLWYKCQLSNLFQDGSNGHLTLVTHDYNTWVNSDFASFETALSSHDFQDSTYETPTQPDPFVSDATGNFSLSSNTVNPHLSDGLPLSSPYDADFAGYARGADGTWERGAYEFNTSQTRPNPPTNLQATPH